MNVIILKRDGRSEPFSFDKLITSIERAGVPGEDSKAIAQKVQNWVSETGKSEIASTKIRDKIVEVLAVDFPLESENYKAYKK